MVVCQHEDDDHAFTVIFEEDEDYLFAIIEDESDGIEQALSDAIITGIGLIDD